MSVILKKGDGGMDALVRPITSIARPNAAQSLPPSQNGGQKHSSDVGTIKTGSVSQGEFTSLVQENKKLLLDLEATKQEIETTRNTAFDDGRKKGQAEALSKEKERNTSIAKAAEKAVGTIAKQFKAIEGLAVLLSQIALNKILGNNENISTLVAQSIAHQVRSIEDLSGIKISVSTVDFPDEHALEALVTAISHSSVEVLTDRKLTSGDCLINMQLGTLDIGIPNQRKKLNALLSDMAEQEQL